MENEQGLLGSLLMPEDSRRVLDLCLERKLKPDAFTVERHQLIFRAMIWLHKNGDVVDIISIQSTLKTYKKLDSIGGANYLEELVDKTPTSAHAEYYLGEIVRLWHKRLAKRYWEQFETSYDKHPDRALSGLIRELTELTQNTGKKQASLIEVRDKMFVQADEAKEGKITGIPSPWPRLNAYTNGLPKGVVTLLGGRGKTRKSYIAHQWGMFAGVQSEHKIPGCYYPLEDGQQKGLLRAACLIAGYDPWMFECGQFGTEDRRAVWEASEKLIQSPYDIRRGRGLSREQFRLDIARGVSKHGWQFIIMDALKDGPVIEGDYRDEGQFMKWAQDVAEEFDIGFMLVHHVLKWRSGLRGQSAKDQTEALTIEDFKGNMSIANGARCVYALQCQLLTHEDGHKYYGNYVLDTLAINFGQPKALPLDLDHETGVFTESERPVWSLWRKKKKQGKSELPDYLQDI